MRACPHLSKLCVLRLLCRSVFNCGSSVAEPAIWNHTCTVLCWSIPFVEDKTSMLLCLELAPLFLPGHAMCTIRINRINGSGCSANAAALFAVMFSEHGGALLAWDSRAAARAPHEHSVLPKFGWQTQQMSSSFNPKMLTSALSPACATCTALWQ